MLIDNSTICMVIASQYLGIHRYVGRNLASSACHSYSNAHLKSFLLLEEKYDSEASKLAAKYCFNYLRCTHLLNKSHYVHVPLSLLFKL